MKKWLRYFGWGLITVLVLSALAEIWRSYSESKEEEERLAVEGWLGTVVLPKFELHEQTLDDAVSILNQAIEAAPNHPEGLKIVVASEKETQELFRRKLLPPPAPEISGLLDIDEKQLRSSKKFPARDRKFTVAYSDIPLSWIVQYYDSDFGVQARRIRARRITLFHSRTEGTVDPLITRVFRFRHLEFGSAVLGLTTSDQTGMIDVRPRLAANGIDFYEGGFANYEAASGKLHVRTTREGFDLIETTYIPHLQPSRIDKLRWWLSDLYQYGSPNPPIPLLSNPPGTPSLPPPMSEISPPPVSQAISDPNEKSQQDGEKAVRHDP